MIKSIIAGGAVVLASLAVFGGTGPQTVNTKLQHVTVYRNGASLEHTAHLYLDKGQQEIVFEGLSQKVDMPSVKLSTPGKITILSLSFSTNYLKEDAKTPALIRLEDSLEKQQQALADLDVLIRTNNELLALLKANQKVGGTQSGMSVEELGKMVEYYRSKTLSLETELSGYRKRQNRINEEIGKLKLQINEVRLKNTSRGGSLIVKLVNPMAGACDFTLSYMTTAARWNPGYDIRVLNTGKPVHVTYKAVLEQVTGIDWKQVKISLATAAPRSQSAAPIFQSWFLSLIDPVARMNQYLATNSIPSVRVRGASALQEVVVTGYGVRSDGNFSDDRPADKPAGPVYIVDGKMISEAEFKQIDPNSIKQLETLDESAAMAIYGSRAAGGAILATLKEGVGDYVSVRDEALNVTYDIDLPYDVSSDGKPQYVSIRELDLPAVYKYYAAPKLDGDAFLLAEMSDWEKLNLLPGEAQVIMEDTYIGKIFIDPHSTSDTLNLTLGHDSRVVVKREKLKDFSSVKFLGSNKKQVLVYELMVKNNKKDSINMILKDQYPLTTNKDIEVELLETSGAAVNPETGVLTWMIDLAPGQSKKVRISYSVKYPKDRLVDL